MDTIVVGVCVNCYRIYHADVIIDHLHEGVRDNEKLIMLDGQYRKVRLFLGLCDKCKEAFNDRRYQSMPLVR